jgi:hypothetical protein
MPNGREEFESAFENVAKSKAILDLARACRLYAELLEKGWPRDKAFLVAFMGIQIIYIPELKPLPEPDPPFFSVPALCQALKRVRSYVSGLKQHIEDELAFLETFPKEPGKP